MTHNHTGRKTEKNTLFESLAPSQCGEIHKRDFYKFIHSCSILISLRPRLDSLKRYNGISNKC